MGNKHGLTDNQIKEMRKEIFEKKGLKKEPFIRVPVSFLEYVMKQSAQTANWKGQVILTYIGIILAYKESYFTYKKYHMNLEAIMSLVGANPKNEKVRKAFSRNSWLYKNDYVKNLNDIPYGYRVEKGNVFYNLASNLSKEERIETIDNIEQRQLRSIEPVRHTKGVRRVRGKGYQILEAPVDSKEAKDYITVTYNTINKLIHNYLTYTEFYILCGLKAVTKNGFLTEAKIYNTSYERMSEQLGVSDKTISLAFKNIKSVFVNNFTYDTKTIIVNGNYVSKSKLIMNQYAI
ncbi:hypothetical protein [Mammaliicoccus sciuri]|uniref:hypothetical protein n=1 Tax=Mammaliicoccus sciuri TaxID=1296 RepID=UPI0021D2271B|nr:hypothetical protein [Mammaliicoccus sciuri]UXU70114.1 hypothetical protein MUA36_05395 [Mammaliicoccus sciuri]